MINKKHFQIKNNKKLLRKIGKKWVVVSAMTLALLGAGSIATTLTTKADVTNQPTEKVTSKQSTNNSSASSTNVPLSAKSLHNAIQRATSSKASSASSAQPSSVTSQTHKGFGAEQDNNYDDNNQGFINSINRDWDAKNNPDAHYNFESSDKMYDTHINDYLNNVNHLTHDKDGEAIRPQMEVTYAWNGHAQNKNISAPKINSSIIKELNNHQIGVLPLYNPGVSMRGNGDFPSDNELMQLQNYTDDQASLGYQPEKIVPYRLVGYLFTAPRGTEFTDLFAKYFYPQTDNGYALDTSSDGSYFSYSVNKTTFTSAHKLPNDLHFSWENNTNAGFSEHDGTIINLEYKPQMNKITFIDKVTGQPVGYWISSEAGSENAINYDLYNFYVNVSSPKTYSKSNIVIPKGYVLANSDMNKFHNTIYPPTGYVPGRFNFGHNYIILLVKPTNDTITYTYNGKKIGGWTSKTEGTTDNENHELVNIYNIITSTNAPGLPKSYWIPNGPKFGENTFAYNNYPLEKFLNTLYPAVGDIKGFNYGKHFVIPVSLINPPKPTNVTIHYVDANTNLPIANDKTVKSNEAKTASTPIDINGFKYVSTKTNGSNITLTYNFNHYKHPNHAKGDIDVFYYHNNALKQYRDYGNYSVGTEFKLVALRKAGFKIVAGNNVTKFNNGIQTVVLISANPNKAPKKLPRVSKVIGSATDYVNYVDGNKVVAVAYNESGKATKLDSDLLTYGSDFTAHKYDKLPSAYKISDATFTKYNNYFSEIRNPNFGGTQLNIPVELKVQPKPQPQKSTITVVFTNNKGDIIKKDKPVTSDVGKQFNMIAYEDQIPAGYEMTGTKNAQYFFPKTNQTVQIVLGKARSQIMIYYYDIDNNQQLKQPEESDEPEGTKFNVNNHLDNLPKGYQFVKATGVNGSKAASDFTSDTQAVDVYLKRIAKPIAKPVTVTVHYVDENGHTIASDNTYQGMPNDNFQFNFKTIPNYSIDYSKLDQDNLIKNAKYPDKNWVSTIIYKSIKPDKKPATPNKPAKPQVQQASDYVIYAYNGKPITPTPAFYGKGNKKVKDKKFIQFADNFGSDFINSDVDGLHKNANLPNGYTLSKQTFSDFGSDFYNNSSYQNTYGTNRYNIPVITENTPVKPQVQNGKIDVQFVEVLSNGQEKVLTPTNNLDKSDKSLHLDGNTVSDDGIVGQTHDKNNVAYDFDTILSPLMPKGFTVANQLSGAGLHGQYDLIPHIISPKANELHFVSDGVGDQALEYMKNPQFIKIGVTPIVNSHITVNYVDDKNKVIKSVTVGGQNGNDFDLIKYEDAIPTGYNLEDIQNGAYYFTNKDQTTNLILGKPQAKVAKSTITVKLVNGANGQFTKYSDTENITTPFNINNYINELPKNIQIDSIKGNRKDFDYNNHTVEVVYSIVEPETDVIKYVGNDGKTFMVQTNHGKNVDDDWNAMNFMSDFDAGKYDGMPKGYHMTKDTIKAINDKIDELNDNNKVHFGQDSLTIPVVVTPKPNKPITPASSKANQSSSKTQPITPSSAKSSGSSKASSASTTPSSASQLNSSVEPVTPSSSAKKPIIVPPASSKNSSKSSASSTKHTTKVIPNKHNQSKVVSHKASSFEPVKQAKTSVNTSTKFANHSSKVTVKSIAKASTNHNSNKCTN